MNDSELCIMNSCINCILGDGKMIQCCPPEPNSHPQCYPILVPFDDPFYAKWEENCLNFVRTAMCPQCRLGEKFESKIAKSYYKSSSKQVFIH